MEKRLIFVYNADSGFFNMAADIAHKLFSPKTYPCSLCDLTYGTFKIRPEWDDFVKNAPIPFEFLHKNEFLLQYPDLKYTPLPVVFFQKGNTSSILVDYQALNGFNTIGELKKEILTHLPV